MPIFNMKVFMKLSSYLVAICMLSFLTFGCAHKKVPQSKAGVSYMDTVITKKASDFYALHLSGQNEIPPHSNLTASGKLFLEVNEEGDKMYFTLYVDSLKNITKATINYGTKTYNGPPILSLYPARHTDADSLIGRTYSGLLSSGAIIEPYLEGGALSGGEVSDLVRVIKHDSAYVEIHTKYMRDGAIRAQINLNQGTGSGQ